jgi:uncharacterized protein with HEPN domain
LKRKDRNYLFYLNDILESIQKIEDYLEGFSFTDYINDQKTVDAVVGNFEIIGEASKNMPITSKSKYPDIPWAEMYLLRHIVSHEYFGVDYEIIWDVAKNHLQFKKEQVSEINIESDQSGLS